MKINNDRPVFTQDQIDYLIRILPLQALTHTSSHADFIRNNTIEMVHRQLQAVIAVQNKGIGRV